MDTEIWKNITGFPNHMISNKGRVRNVTTGNIMKQFLFIAKERPKYKRLRVKVKTAGIMKNLSVHMLVAAAFIDNPNNYTKIKFNDGDSLNVDSTNLSWLSDSDYKVYWKSCLPDNYVYLSNKPKPIIATHKNNDSRIHFDSIGAAALFLKSRNDYINRALAGHIQYHKGYKFEYVDKVN